MASIFTSLLSLVALAITEFQLSLKGLNERKRMKQSSMGVCRAAMHHSGTVLGNGAGARLREEEGTRVQGQWSLISLWVVEATAEGIDLDCHSPSSSAWDPDSWGGPCGLAMYLQGSAVCCRSPCCMTRCLWLQEEVGIFWPRVQLTSFRRRVNTSGYKLVMGVPVETTSYIAQAT